MFCSIITYCMKAVLAMTSKALSLSLNFQFILGKEGGKEVRREGGRGKGEEREE